MKQPKGFTLNDKNQVYKIVKNLYELKQRAKESNKKFDTVMIFAWSYTKCFLKPQQQQISCVCVSVKVSI